MLTIQSRRCISLQRQTHLSIHRAAYSAAINNDMVSLYDHENLAQKDNRPRDVSA